MIREIKEEDRYFIYNIIKKEFNFNYKSDSSFSNWFIYEENNKIIGFVNFDIIYERAEIEYIYVLEDYRRKHIASNLLEAILKKLREKNIFDLSLEVNCNNEKAIKFYEKNGFKKVSIRKNYYGSEDAFLMIKK